ncbi:MAG: ATP synthase F0 subunit B, partial [Acidaminococcaceae bacterium]
MVNINATLIAQILNFIVLLAILAKFAYKPLLKAMDDRRNRIIGDLDSAEQTRLDAEA